jgi:hypothetical protein
MRLTQDTIAALNSGDGIEYELEPFRTKVRVKFGIDDFDQVNSEFKRQQEARLAASRPKVKPAALVPAAPVVVAAPKPKPKCKLHPPAGFPEINSIAYICDDITERINAQATIDLKVDEIYDQRSKAAAEVERKRLEAEQQRKQAEAARLAEEARKKEQAALAASAEIQAALSSDIAKKMIAVCEKKWAEGEHRCYCEKYIKYAPGNIKSNPQCN